MTLLHTGPDGPDETAKGIGLDSVLSSGARTEDEGLYPIQHGYWLNSMNTALESEKELASE